MIIAPPIPQFPAVVAGRGDRARPVRLPALDLRFDLGEVAAGITTTRATTATRFNEFGVLESVVADTLRIDYDPASLRTSSTSLSVGLGVRTLVLSATGPALGDPIRITKTGDVATYMAGRVVYVSGTTVKVNVERKGGSGTFADWQVIGCRGVLVEEQRTNLLTHSNEAENVAWATAGMNAVAANAVTGLDGAATGDTLTEDTSTGVHYITQQIAGLTAGARYSLAYRMQSAGRPTVWLMEGNNTTGQALFNMTTGAVDSVGGNGSPSASITALGSARYCCELALTLVGTVHNSQLRFNNGGTSYTGDGTSGVHLLGQSLEAGDFATSHIPTGATATTRNKDVVSMTGANFSGWYSAPFTMLAEIAAQASGTRVYWEISDGTVNNYISLRSVSGALALVVVTGGVEQASLSLGTVTTGTRYKIAAAWATNDVVASLDGAAVVADASATLPTVDRMHVGADGTAANQPCAPVLRMTGYQVRATNTRLQELSS